MDVLINKLVAYVLKNNLIDRKVHYFGALFGVNRKSSRKT